MWDNVFMIIYENSIGGFIDQCKPENQDLLISQIKSNMHTKLGRGVAPSEERSWRTTLVKISSFFEAVINKEGQYILLEFKLPTTQKRIDVIIVGSDGKRQSLLIIELKGWSKSYESTVPKAVKIDAIYGDAVSHPSAEAEDYKYILTQQYSDINSEFQNLEAVSLLPNYEVLENDPLLNDQFKALLEYIEMYTKSNIEDFKKLISKLFTTSIPRKAVEFLNKLEFKPTMDFKKHLEKQFEDIRLSTSQELAFNKIKEQLDIQFKNPKNKKLIIISGMPGSGKTIVAFKVLGYIFTKYGMNAKLQLPGPEFRSAIKKEFGKNTFANMIGGADSGSDKQVVIIDEAHIAYANGTCKQFYDALFAAQNFVIALIDNRQVINKKSYTKEQVIDHARKEKFDVIELSLKEQFRNGGDALYIDWLNNWINKEDNLQDFYVNNSYEFKVLDDKEFHKKYREYYEKHNTRMASFWTQGWNADFNEDGTVKRKVKVGSENYVWNPNEYWVKAFNEENPGKQIPSWFKKQVLNKNFNFDKKGWEYIAYFKTIQGSEYDYIFVHLPKLFFLNDNNELDVDLSQLDLGEMKYQIWVDNGKPSSDKEVLNKTYYKNRLLVNLTRGKKGTFVFCEDEKLSQWINKKLLLAK